MRTLLKAGIRVPAHVPTVGIHVQVSSPMTATNDWHWMPINGCAPHAVELVHTRHELDRVLRSYGPVVAAMVVRASTTPRFRLIVRGLFTGRLLGQYAWEWSPCNGRYEAEPEPWIVWSKAAGMNASSPTFPGYTLSGLSRYARAVSAEETAGLPRVGIELRSAVRPLAAIPEQIPHLRDKADVPHEDALPDLYGLPSGEAA
jgi:hypothetical protein